MEVGAVKQAFNNEIILLKKNLNQAKIQTIHKLTRKAKTFMEKKGPEPLKEKLKRKAESAVKEVLILKKIKARDIARFIVTHTGKLNEYLNKPVVDNNKACARLLLHKALQEKYNHIREKFSDISIKDLFMSRQERRKLKKEAREKQKDKKKGKAKDNKLDAVNVEGEWNVEQTDNKNVSSGDDTIASDDDLISDNDISDAGSDKYHTDNAKDENPTFICKKYDNSDKSESSDVSEAELSNENNKLNKKYKNSVISKYKPLVLDTSDSDNEGSNEETDTSKSNIKSTKMCNDKPLSVINDLKLNRMINTTEDTSIVNIINKKSDKRTSSNKNKNLKSKLKNRNFHKESDKTPHEVKKMVDPFFITSTGDNYMSLVEPRQPDEVKEVHTQGNRQYRRAVMFGHAPRIKSKRNFEPKNNNFKEQNTSEMYNNKFDSQHYRNVNKREGCTRKLDKNNKKDDSIPEKLHPSWEAKKKQSGILPFQGKKIVFDES